MTPLASVVLESRPRGGAYLEAFADESRPLDVPVTTLDGFLGQDRRPVDLLKIDAEGTEPLIFDEHERAARAQLRICAR